MGGARSRSKGQRGEREVIAILQPVVNEVYALNGEEAPDLQRNLMQSRAGGYDVVGLDWMALEVKRQENISLGPWWEQTLRQANGKQEPVLFYRKNRTPWLVKMLAFIAPGVHVPVTLSVEDFLQYFKWRVSAAIELGE